MGALLEASRLFRTMQHNCKLQFHASAGLSASVYEEYFEVSQVAVTTIRVEAKLVDEAAKILGAKSRT
jgi:hypothetical protein